MQGLCPNRFPLTLTVKWLRRRGALNQTEAEKLDDFFSLLRSSPAPLLLLDYDGTLADFRIDRFTARPWAGIRELLTEIQNDNRTQLRVITGRPAGEINPLLQLPSPLSVSTSLTEYQSSLDSSILLLSPHGKVHLIYE